MQCTASDSSHAYFLNAYVTMDVFSLVIMCIVTLVNVAEVPRSLGTV